MLDITVQAECGKNAWLPRKAFLVFHQFTFSERSEKCLRRIFDGRIAFRSTIAVVSMKEVVVRSFLVRRGTIREPCDKGRHHKRSEGRVQKRHPTIIHKAHFAFIVISRRPNLNRMINCSDGKRSTLPPLWQFVMMI